MNPFNFGGRRRGRPRKTSANSQSQSNSRSIIVRFRDWLFRDPWLLVAVLLHLLGLGGLIDGWCNQPDVTLQDFRYGWDEESARVDAPRIAAQMPVFAIRDTEGNVLSGAGKEARLWRFAKLCNNGQHIPTWRQESGDCVSMGWSNALAYRMAFQIANDGRNERLEIPFPPYGYGTSRVFIGKRQLGRGAGSIGAWMAQASQSYGVATVSQVAELGFKYSGRLADKWGWEGPPQSTVELGKKHRVNQISPVKSWEDARDALAYGFPVTIASNVGFDGGYYDRDGKRFLRRRGRWPHQMCLIGMDDRPGHQKGAYVINSWGTDAHPRPIGDEPPGGFWIDWQDVQLIVSQGDSWAYSDFDGFVVESDDAAADWNIFRDEVAKSDPGEVPKLEEIEKPEPPSITQQLYEVRKWNATTIGITLLVCGSGLLIYSTLRKRTSARRSATSASA